ncbi:MAG: aldehyde dehydrogenase family protein [Elusimicrobia bacterium]|nr:aldehyde dehydrogenase family protein [Elusimicrobiota bacterium]MDE2236919.1 aldehyde dehydrogenase family protein [Elusimicrobiota bacterium]MDE2425011.1 aldehyde dehydrogenase family protein [Elusimicrobiota bacterium]
MTTAPAQEFKVTYSAINADMSEFHKLFDQGLAWARKGMGAEHPLIIDGKAVKGAGEPLADVSPINTDWLLGRFAAASPRQVGSAVEAAHAAQKAWARTPWRERLAILRRASAEIRRRKWEIGAVMSLEVGKSRLEALGDAEESADLIAYYCQVFEQNDGFARPLGKLAPNEKTCDVLRPFGVFACIAPFNFPMALSTGMSSAALIAGNAVVYKPSQETPWTGLLLQQCYAAAGLPSGLFHFITGRGSVIGDAFWKHPKVDGIVFTGSKEVGLRMLKEFSRDWPKPALMELGGKNPAIVCESADLDMAAEGVAKSAFSLQGQKCSACSRVYVDRRIADAFGAKLLERAKAVAIGDPTQRDVYFGPLINARAVKTFEAAVESAKKGGHVLIGGERLRQGALAKGHYVAPTIVQLPLEHELFRRELFVPLLSLAPVSGLDEALSRSNDAEYGLTAGIFTRKKEEIERFFDEIEAGVCYANRRSGATTGAWPGVQSFCGWKGSGATGKGGCGPYYVQQFMREQSRTVME